MTKQNNSLAISLFSEIFMTDQLARSRLSKVLPKGMELSHFTVLNHLSHVNGERSPAQLARSFSVTRGAMTNTLGKLDAAGHIHIRPDWEDARRKFVAISPSGKRACEAALAAIAPSVAVLVEDLGSEKVRAALPILRELRVRLSEED